MLTASITILYTFRPQVTLPLLSPTHQVALTARRICSEDVSGRTYVTRLKSSPLPLGLDGPPAETKGLHQSLSLQWRIPIALGPHVIESIYLIESIREKHRIAPMFAERERYLRYLSEIGVRRERVREVASMLLHVVRLLELNVTRPVGMDEISRGCERWREDPLVPQHRRPIDSTYHFQLVATNWLRFLGSLITPSPTPPRFECLLSDFLNFMRLQRRASSSTLEAYERRLLTFLRWQELRCSEISEIRPADIEEFLAEKRSAGWAESSLAGQCTALKMFFAFLEQQQWCSSRIRLSIPRPRVPRISKTLGDPPSWDDVRRIIDSIGAFKASGLRAKAMFLLCSIYGLRSAEVRGLTLEEIDWRKGTITVRRAKHGKTQQFPLQSEVGEAIAQYLEHGRPKCSCRNVFVTFLKPHRPIGVGSMSAIFSPRIKRLGIVLQQYGPHILRRACATQLLRTGSSLQEIADFLGHSNLRSVSSYARFDPASMKSVCNFSLRGVL